MVRAIVGTLLEVGKGRLTVAGFESVIIKRIAVPRGAALRPTDYSLPESVIPAIRLNLMNKVLRATGPKETLQTHVQNQCLARRKIRIFPSQYT